jgi:hypothetical protein
MDIPDEAIEAAARALHKHFSAEDETGMVSDFPSDEYLCCAREALEAAAPHLMAAALSDAANEYRHYKEPNASIWLRDRAAAIEGEAK